jgi:VanZ family protein
LPALLWLATIAVFSTQFFGAGNTGATLRGVLRFLNISISEPQFQVLHYLVRKAAHFSAYAALSALFFRALRGTDAYPLIWKLRYALIPLAICFVTASSDEIHQTFTKGRTGNWHDVMLDMIGAAFIQVAILFATGTRWAQSRWRDGAGVSRSRTAATVARVAER